MDFVWTSVTRWNVQIIIQRFVIIVARFCRTNDHRWLNICQNWTRRSGHDRISRSSNRSHVVAWCRIEASLRHREWNRWSQWLNRRKRRPVYCVQRKRSDRSVTNVDWLDRNCQRNVFTWTEFVSRSDVIEEKSSWFIGKRSNAIVVFPLVRLH